MDELAGFLTAGFSKIKHVRLPLYYSPVPEGIQPAQVWISEGKIQSVHAYNEILPEGNTADLGNLHLFPGLIDCHVHINEPGRTDWEGFETATRAAAAGGITSLIEMPLNASPVTTNQKAFSLKLEASEGKRHVHCGFWGGLIPGNQNELEALLEAGTFGLKAFLTHSGIDEFPNATEEDLRQALKILKKYDKPLLAHCELDLPNPDAHFLEENPRSYQAYLKSRPQEWEVRAIKLMIRLCRETGARVHIVHLSAADALPVIRKAKSEGLPLTVETCPHYLAFSAEEIPDGATEFKCAPPIRERENNEKLWEAVADGTIDFLGSDHSPAPPDIKELESGNFKKAWGGIAGLQFLLPSFWTGAHERGFKPASVAQLISEAPARFCGLEKRKGKIAPGFDADLFAWDPEAKFQLTAEQIQHRHRVSPYLGKTLTGTVFRTFVGGKPVYDSGRFLHLGFWEILLRTNDGPF